MVNIKKYKKFLLLPLSLLLLSACQNQPSAVSVKEDEKDSLLAVYNSSLESMEHSILSLQTKRIAAEASRQAGLFGNGSTQASLALSPDSTIVNMNWIVPETPIITVEDLDEESASWAKGMIEQIQNEPRTPFSYEQIVLGGHELQEAVIHSLAPNYALLKSRYNYDLCPELPDLFHIVWTSDVVGSLDMEAVEKIRSIDTRAFELVKATEDFIAKGTAGIEKGMSRRKAYVQIHDFVCQYFTFDMSNLHTPLIENIASHTAVCEGYARAVDLLCESVGIECRVIHGDSTSGAHIWNEVYIEDTWFSSDPTWDDPDDVLIHTWFLVEGDMYGHTVWKKEY